VLIKLKYKKIAIFTLIFLFISSTIAYAKLSTFKDVFPDKWYAKTIEEAYNLGLVNGYEDQTFRPEQYITRGEAAQIALNIYKSISNNVKNNCCTEEKTIIDNVIKTLPKTVEIRSKNLIGSGFFVSQNLIVTDWHVVSNSDDATCVIVMFNKQKITGKIIKEDKNRDLALIEVVIQDVEPILFAEDVSVGETAIAIGSPLGLDFSVTKGMVSHLNREMNNNLFTQIDTPINFGNSGGLVIDMTGKLIGVVQSKVIDNHAEGLSFIIPYQFVREFVQSVQIKE
jgi:S1-C subfamily serine protease